MYRKQSFCMLCYWICTFLLICLISQAAVSMLKQDYKEDCSLKEALALAVKVMSKSLDSTKMAPDKGIDIVRVFFAWCLLIFEVELSTLTRENEKVKIRVLPSAEVQRLIKDYEEQEEKEKREKEKEKERKEREKKAQAKK